MITGAIGMDVGGCIGHIKPISRLDFTGICMLDGPQAINRADLVSIFPSGILAGATWDEDLIFARGKAMADEFRGKGAHVQLGPVAGPLGRHALGGRNWEGFSPDPYLAGKAMRATVHGIQSVGVQACSKHYIGNEQETQRSNTFSPNGTEVLAISSNIDDRTFHELYLWPFADAVRAGTAGVMCSYNRLNQTYACENEHILHTVLRDELGFRGYVVSDWFATHSGTQSINAGLDVNMPGPLDEQETLSRSGRSYWGVANVTQMVNDGAVAETRIDEMVHRIMLPYYYLKQDQGYPSVDPSLILSFAAQQGIQLQIPMIPSRDVRADHAQIIRKMGAQGIVLLKNANQTLPLKSPKSIGIFGNDAGPPVDGLVFGDRPFAIGTLDIGGGSGTGRHTYLVSPFEAIAARAKEINARVQYIMDNQFIAANDFRSIFPMPEVCLVFLNTFASEGWDRTSYEADWNSTLVVDNVARRCPNTVVVTHSAGINTLPWARHPNVTAILAAHLPGQEAGNSIVDVLWGTENPSGRLPYSIPVLQSDYDIPIANLTASEVTKPDAWQADFAEGQFIDYRHFDHFNITPLYEFGFGLSYTSFILEGSIQVESVTPNLTAKPAADSEVLPGGKIELWESVLRITANVKNTGPVAGATVLQLYVAFPARTTPKGTPVQVLRGFRKIHLQPSRAGLATFDVFRRDVSFWDVVTQTWVIPAGEFDFRVGFSSRDIVGVVSHAVLP
ncbi:glycosyl hydrolase family 3 N terminal domain-containing protein [Boeremia exigua]|uniref:glycosyl hydrolase family 3 N terminal domain-containing protein n=1 Tax=Boeremia exigua TaxID=749465 RepID=UPI001E8DC122|nr:glycosyl hydrolase family 3 N terminal domain-containing protein [Boeremia exigua]KAH6642730.1 glycosyl hydrolase family 3 N terminal domain-containing protein [Boeremia exigua]